MEMRSDSPWVVIAAAGVLVVGCLFLLVDWFTVVSLTSGFGDASPLTVVLAVAAVAVLWAVWVTTDTAFED
jgi:hypothetical protein